MSSLPNPFETPRPRGVRLLQGTLRVIVAVQCLGFAAARLELGTLDPLCELIGRSRDLPDDQLVHFSRILGYVYAGCGILTLLRPITLILMFIIAAQVAAAVIGLLPEPTGLAILTPALHASRIAAPFALILIDFWPPRIKATLILCQTAVALLRGAIVITLAALGLHDLFQIRGDSAPLQTIQQLFERTLHHTLVNDQAALVLAARGAICIALAASLASSRNRLVGAVAVVWGLLLAFSPILSIGPDGAAESLQRISEAGVPLALLVFWMRAIRRPRVEYIPESRPDLESDDA